MLFDALLRLFSLGKIQWPDLPHLALGDEAIPRSTASDVRENNAFLVVLPCPLFALGDLLEGATYALFAC